jgi:hypothetical protein
MVLFFIIVLFMHYKKNIYGDIATKPKIQTKHSGQKELCMYKTVKKYLPEMKNRQKAEQIKTADSVCMLYLFEHDDKLSIPLGLLLKGSVSEFRGIDYGLHKVSFS